VLLLLKVEACWGIGVDECGVTSEDEKSIHSLHSAVIDGIIVFLLLIDPAIGKPSVREVALGPEQASTAKSSGNSRTSSYIVLL
jgi:hypothetical protein